MSTLWFVISGVIFMRYRFGTGSLGVALWIVDWHLYCPVRNLFVGHWSSNFSLANTFLSDAILYFLFGVEMMPCTVRPSVRWARWPQLQPQVATAVAFIRWAQAGGPWVTIQAEQESSPRAPCDGPPHRGCTQASQAVEQKPRPNQYRGGH